MVKTICHKLLHLVVKLSKHFNRRGLVKGLSFSLKLFYFFNVEALTYKTYFSEFNTSCANGVAGYELVDMTYSSCPYSASTHHYELNRRFFRSYDSCYDNNYYWDEGWNSCPLGYITVRSYSNPCPSKSSYPGRMTNGIFMVPYCEYSRDYPVSDKLCPYYNQLTERVVSTPTGYSLVGRRQRWLFTPVTLCNQAQTSYQPHVVNGVWADSCMLRGKTCSSPILYVTF